MMKKTNFLWMGIVALALIAGCRGEKIHLPAPGRIYTPAEKDNPLMGYLRVYRTEKLPQTEEVIPGLYFLAAKMDGWRIMGQRAFIYFYVGKDEIVVFDTGEKRYGYNGEDLKKAIRKVSDKPVGAIYLTHKHPDHVGNAVSLQQALENHPPIYIGEPDYNSLSRIWKRFGGVPAEYLEKNLRKLPLNPGEKKSEVYNPGYAGTLEEGWEYYPACCHSPGNVVFFNKKLSVIIVGNWYQGCLERDKPIKSLMEKEKITTMLFSHPHGIGQICKDKEKKDREEESDQPKEGTNN